MIFKTITVSDSRQLPDGNWKKLEWVAELEKDEVPEMATRMVKERIDQTFVTVYGVNTINERMTFDQPLPEEQVQPKDGWERLVDAINSCTELDGNTGLKTFEKLVELNNSKHPEIQIAYDNKLKELTHD